MHAISRDDSQRNDWRTRRDLNPQHPVPKTGDTPSDTAREQEVTTTTESMPAESPALACESTPDVSIVVWAETLVASAASTTGASVNFMAYERPYHVPQYPAGRRRK